MAQDHAISSEALRRQQWFIHDRFGLFIHWGLYALPARHEWVKNREKLTDEHYQRYFDHFDPDLYDPAEWARLAKRAGMRYAVITTKHHEGFCLWDSQLTDYKAPNTPAGRDLLRAWVDAFRAEGLKIGFYHSLIDWHHPEFPVDGLHPQRDDRAFRERAQQRDVRKYAEYLHGQVRELLTNYGQIDMLWFDFSYADMDWGWAKGKGKDDWQSKSLLRMVRELQPGILVNNRAEIDPDFHTPEQVQPRGWMQIDGKRVTWEACQTLNGSWGYDRDNQNWKSPDLLVRMLVDSVSKGGNLLLNVGPTARGEFDPRAQATLQALGAWMRLHQRAIYGATQSEFAAPPDCRLTQRDDRLYLHVFAWPMGAIHLDGLAHRVAYAQFLHDGSEVQMSADSHTGDGYSNADTLTLALPIQRPDVLVPVIELFLQ
jgi:alpha-L-fucosidase